MSGRLKEAFAEAAKLPEDQQEAFAEFLLEELRDEQEWQKRFAASADLLSKLADEALVEFRSGRTEPLEDLLK